MHTDIRPPRRTAARRRRFRSQARRSPRRGRLLLECLVATVLLDATALVVASLAVGVIASAQRTRQLSVGWAIASQQLEQAAARSCAAPLIDGAGIFEGLPGSWRESDIGPLARDARVTVVLPTSAQRALGVATLSARDARWCP